VTHLAELFRHSTGRTGKSLEHVVGFSYEPKKPTKIAAALVIWLQDV
jgi:hypothetical protein